MSLFENEIDANFFSLIHRLVGTEEDGSSGERRGGRRRPLRSVQRIAPRRGPGIPDDSEFDEVRCQDLTQAGFSFLMAEMPPFHGVVASFGPPGEAIYVAARVVHCENVLVYPDGRVEPRDGPSEVHGDEPPLDEDLFDEDLLGEDLLGEFGCGRSSEAEPADEGDSVEDTEDDDTAGGISRAEGATAMVLVGCHFTERLSPAAPNAS